MNEKLHMGKAHQFMTHCFMSSFTFHTLLTSTSLVPTYLLRVNYRYNLYNQSSHLRTIYKYIHTPSFLLYPYFSLDLLNNFTARPSTKHNLNCTNRTLPSHCAIHSFVCLCFHLTELSSWVTLFQRTLVGTAFLC